MKNAIYVRTSTADQDGAAQLHALRRAAAGRGWIGFAEYVDLGHSGTKASRPALDQLRRDARAGDVQEVLVVALDRVGRSLRDLLLLLDELTAAGCAFISLRESIDLTTPAGRLMVQMIGALAEFERSLIVDRVKSGITKARDAGTRSGRAIGRPRREVDIELVLSLRAQGKSWRKIAMTVKCPMPTLRRAVARAETPMANAAA